MSIYDAVSEVVVEIDREIERRLERAFDARTPYLAGIAFQYVYVLRGLLLNLLSAQDKNIDAIFAAVSDIDTFVECPF